MPDPEIPPPKRDDNPAHSWARYSQIAFLLPSAVVVGLLLGALADRWFHTGWLIVVGVILGAVAGFVQLTRILMRAEKE